MIDPVGFPNSVGTLVKTTSLRHDLASGSMSEPPSVMDHTNCACQNNVEEMRGFKVCLVFNQVLMLLVMFTAVLTVYFLNSNAYLLVTIFAYVEVVILVFALVHACRPSIHMMLIFLALEVTNAVCMIVFALIVAIRNSDKDCSKVDCGWFPLDVEERFYLFWFLLAKATFALFLGLVALAISPQMHDYMAEDECERAIFQSD